MRRIFSSKRDSFPVRFGIFLIIAALITGFPSSYSVDGNNNQPSENLEIYTWYDLDDIRYNLSGDHILMNNLNSTTEGYEELASPTANEGKGWQPIGYSTPGVVSCMAARPGEDYGLFGTLDGQGHEIRDLFINRSDENNVGLFYYIRGRIINLGLTNVTVTGSGNVGSLVGWNEGTVDNSYSIGNVAGESTVGGLTGSNRGTVLNSYSSGNVNGSSCVGGLAGSMYYGSVENSHSMCSVIGVDDVGGLLGYSYSGTVSNSYSTGNVTGDSDVGGLLGLNGWKAASGSNIYDCYSGGNVDGSLRVGGLVGHNYYGTVSNSYATGNVTGDSDVGGLVGVNSWEVGNREENAVRGSYSTGNINGNQHVGGLVGHNYNYGTVSNSYATGNVTGDSDVGGLVGLNGLDVMQTGGRIRNSYSTGNVNGNQDVGGLVGHTVLHSTVLNSFWDTETSGLSTSDGGTGKNTTEMKNITTFSGVGWNITAVSNTTMRDTSYIWNIVNNVTYPFLSWQP